MVTLRQVERLVETYSLEEVLEYNEKTEAECLYFLLKEEFVDIPEPRPVDLEDD